MPQEEKAPTVMIELDVETLAILDRLADIERRTPENQARYLLEGVLWRVGEALAEVDEECADDEEDDEDEDEGPDEADDDEPQDPEFQALKKIFDTTEDPYVKQHIGRELAMRHMKHAFPETPRVRRVEKVL